MTWTESSVGGERSIDMPEEFKELFLPVSWFALRKDLAGCDVQSGKERCRAMPEEVVISALQCLALTLSLDAQNQAFCGGLT